MKEQEDGSDKATQYEIPDITENLSALVDFFLATELTDDDNMTWEELALALGVTTDEEGDIDGVEMYNACLNAHSNPAVLALPQGKRARVIKCAFDALGKLRDYDDK